MTELTLSKVTYRGILHAVSAGWSQGTLVGLIGPNGAGKTTLLRIAAGVARQDAGEVELDGRSIARLSVRARAQEIAYLPQQIPDNVPFTVREFVAMGRYAHRERPSRSRQSHRDAVDGALAQMNLVDEADVPMYALSGGERQRVGVARCLAQRTRVLLLDEPIASLDLYYQLDILTRLRALAESGYLVVIAIHHLELAVRFCDEFLLLDGGRVYASGTADQVITQRSLADVFHVAARTYRDPEQGTLRFFATTFASGSEPR